MGQRRVPRTPTPHAGALAADFVAEPHHLLVEGFRCPRGSARDPRARYGHPWGPAGLPCAPGTVPTPAVRGGGLCLLVVVHPRLETPLKPHHRCVPCSPERAPRLPPGCGSSRPHICNPGNPAVRQMHLAHQHTGPAGSRKWGLFFWIYWRLGGTGVPLGRLRSSLVGVYIWVLDH